eukprot:1708073-Heterocapsa_arctica.AAC.1
MPPPAAPSSPTTRTSPTDAGPAQEEPLTKRPRVPTMLTRQESAALRSGRLAAPSGPRLPASKRPHESR